MFLDLGTAPEGDLAPSGAIGGTDTAPAHDDAAGGEIGTLNAGHDLIQTGIGVIQQQIHRVNDFAQVMGRDIGCHTNGDTGTAVHQDIGEPAGQNRRLLQTVIVVGAEVDGFLVDVGEHHSGDLAHLGFGISVCCRRVAVHRTEVAVSVHQRVTHGEVLCQTHQGIIDRSITMGVVPSQYSTDCIRAFAVSLLRREAVFIHGIENPAMDRLQAVPHIGQGTAHDYRHRIIQETLFHLLFDVDRDDLIVFLFHSSHQFRSLLVLLDLL